MIITVTGVPIVEMSLTLLDGQGVIGIDLSFGKVLIILNIDRCFISAILGARACNLSSCRFETFRDCLKLKLSI